MRKLVAYCKFIVGWLYRYERQIKQTMYNVHQYNLSVRAQERQKYEEQQFAKYLLRHEDYKELAAERVHTKGQAFVQEQSQSPRHFVFEDDHFARWRPNKQYRDVEDSTKFISFKTFRHRPNQDMDKYFTERQRREILELSQRKQPLVQSKLIPEAQRSRSLRCQGPLNPKTEFRQRRKDHEYLQPRLRFTNVTDKQRQNESAFSFDDKFRSLYSSFEMTKSKIGRATVSPRRSLRYGDALDFIEEANSEMGKSKPFYFDRDHHPEDDSPIAAKEVGLQQKEVGLQQKEVSSPRQKEATGLPSKEASTNSQLSSPRSKTYFKLAKTLQLKSNDPKQKGEIEQLLKKTQFERTKHLTNIVNNNTAENFFKKPIL